ncbi:MAG: glycosyltransferase [Gammaproteobacteria bacterium]|nr:glycosyltransferase [Gammaproteobacteria bacterium]
MQGDSVSLPYHKVCIGMPVYNGEKYLEESIQSNLAQDFDDFALIISDNASTDSTPEICRQYAQQDARVHYIKSDINLGASRNYARCFEPADCEYFRWANADDLAEPTLVSKCVEVLDKRKDCVLVYGKTNIIDGDGRLIEQYDDNLNLESESAAARFIQFNQSVGLSNVLYGLMRHKELARTALFGNYIASDINLIGELTLYGKFVEIPEYLFSRRMHEQASSWDRSNEQTQKDFWDPARKRMLFQVWRSVYEYYKAVLRAPVSFSEKVSLAAYLGKYSYWHKNELLIELSDFVKYSLSRRS